MTTEAPISVPEIPAHLQAIDAVRRRFLNVPLHTLILEWLEVKRKDNWPKKLELDKASVAMAKLGYNEFLDRWNAAKE
jgi:hypothetical protein